MQRFRRYILLLVCLSLVASSCTKIKDLFNPPSPRERYQRDFQGDEVSLMLWESAYERALDERLTLQLPYGETGFFFPGHHQVYSYETDLQRGEVFHFDLLTDDPGVRIFIDFFKVTIDE